MSNNIVLSKERKGQIALAKLKLNMLRDGFKLHPQSVRSDLGNAAKQLNAADPTLNVTTDEVRALLSELVAELTAQCFQRPRFSPETLDDIRRDLL